MAVTIELHISLIAAEWASALMAYTSGHAAHYVLLYNVHKQMSSNKWTNYLLFFFSSVYGLGFYLSVVLAKEVLHYSIFHIGKVPPGRVCYQWGYPV